MTLSRSLGQARGAPSPALQPRGLGRAAGTYHADELGQGQLQLDGDELGRAGGWADQLVVAGSVQKVIYKPLLCIGHAAVPWGDTWSDPPGPHCWP